MYLRSITIGNTLNIILLIVSAIVFTLIIKLQYVFIYKVFNDIIKIIIVLHSIYLFI